jgi:hypothetical protein
MNGARDHPQTSEEGKRGVAADGPQAQASEAAAHPPEGHVERLRRRMEIERDPVATHSRLQASDRVEGQKDGGVQILVDLEDVGGRLYKPGEVDSRTEAEAVVKEGESDVLVLEALDGFDVLKHGRQGCTNRRCADGWRAEGN